jgi:ribose 5-phosphate isomerase A
VPPEDRARKVRVVRGHAVIQMLETTELEKRLVGEAAATLIEDGMLVGLGTGSTVAHFLPALASRALDIRCVATSLRTEAVARGLGLRVEPFEQLDRLDVAVDGADQVAPSAWLVKGGGGAHTREKVVAVAAKVFVVVASSDKLVDALRPPVPLELLPFGVTLTLAALAPARLRDAPRSPDGNVIADYLGPVNDPAALAERLSTTPGVVEHGLFPPGLVHDVLVGHGTRVERFETAAVRAGA